MTSWAILRFSRSLLHAINWLVSEVVITVD